MKEYSYLPGGNLHSMESHDEFGTCLHQVQNVRIKGEKNKVITITIHNHYTISYIFKDVLFHWKYEYP